VNYSFRSVAILFCAASFLLARSATGLAQESMSKSDRVPVILEQPSDPYAPRGMVAPVGISVVPRTPAGSVQVNVDGAGMNIPGDAANEPSIAVDVANPSRMAIGWRQFDTIASNFRQAGRAYTANGGVTWTNPGVLMPGVFRSDPVLRADGFGRIFYCSLQGTFCMDSFRSLDGGVTYPLNTNMLGGDKAWMDIDRRTTGIGAGNIYSAWSFGAPCVAEVGLFTRSTDAGLTWMTPIDEPVPSVFGTLAVGPDGEVYVAGVDFPSFSNSTFVVLRSTDARNPNVTPTWDAPAVGNFLGGSLEGGGAPNPGGLLGQVWVGVNHAAGPNRGHVYLLCSVDPPGADPLDVMFSRSIDGGQTWSIPVRVNDDPTTNGAWQWFATMGVAPNGRIDVIWNDTRDNPGGSNLSRVYYSYSIDEGTTWTANVAKTPQFDSLIGWPSQNKIGDYYDMYSDIGGTHIAYSATFNGEQDLYYMHIDIDDCDTDGVPDAVEIAGPSDDCNSNGIPDECEPDCNGNNIADECEVPPLGVGDDCNSNLIPDECEPDCNTNDVPDVCDVPPIGPGPDCNSNGIPDDCDPQDDCNTNGILDICDLAGGSSADCNNNAIPDECEVPPLGAGADCNTNLVPDECEPSTDCNNNAIADICDLASGSSDDCDSDTVPDECQFDGVFTLLSADFEGGMPGGWSTTGLWHATSACPRANTCNPTQWAYYGIDAQCNFNTGATTLGSMTAPPVAVHPDTTKLTLTYCSAYAGQQGNSNVNGRDWAWVTVNGVEVDDISLGGNQTTWETREVNLVGYAGQNITLAWRFDSRDAVSNTSIGCQVDQITLTAVVANSDDCNLNDTLDDCEIAAGTAGDCNKNGTLDECEASPVVCPCPSVLGNVDAVVPVDGQDIDNFVGCYLAGPGVLPSCGCADMDQNGVVNQVDVNLFTNCLIGAGCP
jgi:hypothetical protein